MAEPRRITRASRRQSEKKRSVPTYVMVLAFLMVAGIGYFAGVNNSGQYIWGGGIGQLVGGSQLDVSSLQQTYQAVKANFDGEIDDAKLIEGANKGMVEALGDQYTVFMNKKESTEFDDSLTGNIGGGIGVEVGMRNDIPTAIRVLKDNPAEKAGVMVGDIIYKINDETLEDLTLTEIVKKIRGEIGTSVKLTIIRDGAEKDISITRDQVNNPSAYGEIKNNIGVLSVTRFDNDTGNLARAVAQDFKAKGVKGVILDLRGNGGGYVTASQALAGIWLDNQLVVTEKRGSSVVEELKSTGTPLLKGIPTIVLVNESSASASEIVAGALRDQKVATIIGETTFGKGSVQKLMQLMDGATLKVTVAKWYTPGNVNISEKGITPDRIVLRTGDDINAGKDPQLDAALSSF